MKRAFYILGSVAAAGLIVATLIYAQEAQHNRAVVASPSAPSAQQSSTPQVAQLTTSSAKLLGTSTPAISAPVLAAPTANPNMLVVNSSTPITVTIQITDTSLIPGSVSLLLLGATGTQPTILGVMQSQGNGIYSLQPTFNETTTGQVQLEVSAAFRGQLRRAISPIVDIQVWGVLTDTMAGFGIAYPPVLYNVTPAGSTSTHIYALDSSPQGVNIGGAIPDTPSNISSSGFNISIEARPYASSSFDIAQFLSTEYAGYDIATNTSVSVGGQPGYEITFQSGEGAGQPLVVAYFNGYIYQISYDSTYAPGSPSNDTGLAAFEAVVQSFSFIQ